MAITPRVHRQFRISSRRYFGPLTVVHSSPFHSVGSPRHWGPNDRILRSRHFRRRYLFLHPLFVMLALDMHTNVIYIHTRTQCMRGLTAGPGEFGSIVYPRGTHRVLTGYSHGTHRVLTGALHGPIDASGPGGFGSIVYPSQAQYLGGLDAELRQVPCVSTRSTLCEYPV
jgi:hypothetical protein